MQLYHSRPFFSSKNCKQLSIIIKKWTQEESQIIEKTKEFLAKIEKISSKLFDGIAVLLSIMIEANK